MCSCDIHNFLSRNRNLLTKILRKTKSGHAASKTKAPKFEKELTFLAPYIFDEETRQSHISAPSTLSQDEQSNDDMDSNGTADNNNTAILPTPLRLRQLRPPLTVYKRTDEKELIHTKNLLQHPFFRNI